MSYTENETINVRNVEDEMKESYLRYSMSVIISRALPDVRDGLKPSQRRILYAMRELNLSPGAKHRKCAKICGDTSGDYHPHGEQVIYPTLVRMSQDWMMRYPLIQGQGNFGSVDGDPPAAMRYTEARMTAASMQLMEDLDKDTVDLLPNYDETKTEPSVLPARFPNLLCNGSSGIAVGMATNIPPHNLNELINATKLYLENRAVTIEEIMAVMPAPDFPTGGIICGYRGIKEAFHTGRGKLTLRALIREEERGDDKQSLVVDELPYNVNKSRLIEHVAHLVNNKDIVGISDLRDESDKDGMRIVFELKKGVIPEVVLNQLYKFTDLQITFGCNMLALDKGLPRIMNVKQMIAAWVEHRIEVIRRRTRFELRKAEARAHILEGYLRAIGVLDEVIEIIKSSSNRDGAKAALMENFSFTDRQAHAVLDLRLYQLTGLEHEKIDEEYKNLLNKIEYLQSILASELMVREIIIEELLEIQKKNPSDRRTQIIAAEGEVNMEDLIENTPVVITISQDDYIKRMPLDTFKEQRRGGTGVAGFQVKRGDDSIKDLFIANAHDHLMIFTSFGRCYWLKVWQVPETGRRTKGKALVNLLEDILPDEKIATIMTLKTLEQNAYLLMATRQGVVKKTALSAYSNPRRKGVNAITIDENDELMNVCLIEDGQQIMLFTRNGMAVRFDEKEVRAIGRTGRGVRGVTLRDPEDCVVGCDVVVEDDSILIVCEKGYGKRSSVSEFRQTRRGGVGVRSIITSERNGLVQSALMISNDEGLVIMSSSGQTVRMNVEGLRIMGRSTQGVRLINLKDKTKDRIVAVQKTEYNEEATDEPTEEEGDDLEIPEEIIDTEEDNA